MDKISKYLLSFTAASLRLNESIKMAETAIEQGITDLSQLNLKDIVSTSVKLNTSDREFREIRKRLEKLTPVQRDILIHGDLISRKQIAFLALCKHYAFIRDFVVEVIRNKTLVFDYRINESDFNAFINSKLALHPELEEFSETTLRKAKQVMFRILEQAGLINNAVEKVIQPQLLQSAVYKAIVEDDRNMLRIFFLSDRDIDNIKP